MKQTLLASFLASGFAISGCTTVGVVGATGDGSGGSAGEASVRPVTEGPPKRSNAREVIAKIVEERVEFRTILDGGAPKLRDAKIRGPFQYKHLVGQPRTLYCVSAEIEQPLSSLLREIRTVRIGVTEGADGRQIFATESMGISGNRPM